MLFRFKPIDVIRGIKKFLSGLSWKVWLAFGVGLLIILYSVIFFVPKKISFDYSQTSSCVNRLIIFPDYHEQSGSGDFELSTEGGFSIGSFKVVSTKVCASLSNISSESAVKLKYSPLGWPVFASNFTINIGEKPSVKNGYSETISILSPMTFELDSIDDNFKYLIYINDQYIDCDKESNSISCDVSLAGLSQGESYEYKLLRQFKDSEYDDVLSGNIAIVPPVDISSETVINDSIVYSRPKEFVFRASKDLESANIDIYAIDDDERNKLESSYSIDGDLMTLSIETDLDRQVEYEIVIDDVKAVDDSTLVGNNYSVKFTTSGGPTVKNINIGVGGVGLSATVVITLDQALANSQNIYNYVSISGGSAAISYSSDKIYLQLKDMTICGAFTITVGSELVSSYDIKSDQAWSYTSRASCRTTSVIGYSVQGRPIYAYYYGNGSTKILFTGGIHGTEHSGQYIMLDWANYLDTYAYNIPSDRQVIIVPSTNPDGLAGSYRYNANGVNLDRNFPTANWVSDIDVGTGIIIGVGGSAPLSEPEAIALATLTQSLMPRLEVSFHAYGSLVGANQYGDSTAIGNLYTSLVGYGSMIGIADEVMGGTLTGEYEDWMGEQYGIPAILIELPTNYGYYFNYHLDALWRMVGI